MAVGQRDNPRKQFQQQNALKKQLLQEIIHISYYIRTIYLQQQYTGIQRTSNFTCIQNLLQLGILNGMLPHLKP